MLEELKRLEYPGGKEELLFFLQSIIGGNHLTIDDIHIICSHVPGKYQLIVDSLLNYCACFDWVVCDNDYISLNEKLLPHISSSITLNRELIYSTIDSLFLNSVFKGDMFSFDVVQQRYFFQNERLPLSYSAIRNSLISQGFFDVIRDKQKSIFYIGSDYEDVVASFCKKSKRTLSLDQLKKRIEANEIAGEMAEHFVLDFEIQRLGKDFASCVRIISDIDVGAGYDIISFESNESQEYDRFIEVKATSNSQGFFWSSNEYETAKLKGPRYYLYLVDLRKIRRDDYVPLIIKDPAAVIMESEDWLVEPQTYQITKI